jgi:hypothetical protein
MDVPANFGNLPTEFVPLNNRIGSVRMFAVINVDVRSAYPNPADTQQNVMVAEDGLRHFRELDFPGTCHGGAKHLDPPRRQDFAWVLLRRGQEQRAEAGIGAMAPAHNPHFYGDLQAAITVM